MANTDQSEGTAKKIKGDLKEAAGRVTGDKDMENEGKADQVEGEAQTLKGDIKDAI